MFDKLMPDSNCCQHGTLFLFVQLMNKSSSWTLQYFLTTKPSMTQLKVLMLSHVRPLVLLTKCRYSFFFYSVTKLYYLF